MRFASGGGTARLAPQVRKGLAGALIVISTILHTSPVRAEQATSAGWREVWTGADVSADVWLVYSGVTVAPMGHIHSEGIRVRAADGYGEYRYSDKPFDGEIRTFQARTHFADVLVGYQTRFGELTAKAFIGASLISHDIAPFDDETLVIGSEVGVKGVLEFWLNMGPKAWGSLDLSWASAYDTRSARLRTGYRFWPSISVGLEGGVNVDAQGECRMQSEVQDGCRTAYDEIYDAANLLDYARAGVFVRHEWSRGEVSVSGGVLGGSFRGDDTSSLSPYATLTWLTQF
jgi:hypothetical protein